MAALILPSRRVVQPQGAVEIDWGNPLSRGLLSARIFGSSPVDLVNGVFGEYQGASSEFNTNRIGVGFDSSPARLSSNWNPQFSSGDLGVAWLGSVNSLPGASGQMACQRVTATDGGLTFQLSLFASNSIEFQAHAGANGRISITQSSVGFSLGSPRLIAGTIAGTSQKLFVDGIVRGTRTTTIPLTNQPVPVHFGALSGGTEPINATHNLFLLWDRAPLDAEMRALNENPWQLFRPLNRSVYFLPAGTGGGSGTTYTIVPTGNVSFSGNVTATTTQNINPSGNVLFSGNAPLSFTGAASSFTIVPNGAVALAGVSTFSRGSVFTSGGTLSFSGSSVPNVGFQISPSGDFTLAGGAILSKGKVVQPSGSVQFMGGAPISSNTVVETNSVTKLPLTFAGKT